VSLRRRITAAAALAGAAVAISLSVTAYLSTRAHLVSELQQQLRTRAQPYLHKQTSGNGGSDAADGGPGTPAASNTPKAPSNPPLGGAPGYFQFVYPDGKVAAAAGGTPALPVDERILEIAKRARGSSFTTARVDGIHVEVLTVGDPDGYAVEVALPLTSVDSVLHGLVLTYALLVGGGVLLAGLLGAAIAKAALSPIRRFSEQTEQVTSALDHPRRLEEKGASELRRLAASFNQTVDALEQSVQAQRHLVADASHELRTPMAALRSNIQIFLEADRLPEAERGELQRAIIAELDDLTQLVADVVELARGAEPSEHTESTELDLIVREAVARAQRRAPSLNFHLELEPTAIVNSPDRVSRAVTNVIDNARKWSPPGGRIDVALANGWLSVRDHGPGFKEQDLAHVFDRFYRAEEARRMPGSGLGLAIVKQAAEAHGGRVQATNAAGGGALLRVSFGSAVTTEPVPSASSTTSR
jgi:two-component system sensor histidine kinase MprB